MKILTLALQPIIYTWIFILLLITMLPISLIALPFSTARRFKMTAPFWCLFFNLCLKTGVFASVYTKDLRDKEVQKAISPKGLYIGNHQSIMDIPLLYSHMVSPPIMKKSLIYVPVLGICAYSSGAIIVDRKDPNSRKKVMHEATRRLLSKDFMQLQYYPEGTRNRISTSPKPLKEIKTRLMLFAYQNNVPVYPFSMAGTQNILRKNLIHLRQKIGIILHDKLEPKDFQSSDDFIKACWDKVIEGNQELREKLTLG